jgi:uncharacterized protein (TIGR04255 family)
MKSRSEPQRAWQHDPLTGPIASEIPLPDAPLVRVIAQVKFPPVMAILQPDFIGPFQEAIRATYTDLSRIDIPNPEIQTALHGGVPQRILGPWRFQTPEEGWMVSLAHDFVALEATTYSSRADFMNRLREILVALETHVGPRTVERIGVRYVDRLNEDCLNDIATLVRPEVLGLTAHPHLGSLALSITESVFALDGCQLTSRWGLVPANATYDPGAVEPRPVPSWVLDLDMFRIESRRFSVDEAISDANAFSERIYTVFRWAVTDRFLERFGGQL